MKKSHRISFILTLFICFFFQQGSIIFATPNFTDVFMAKNISMENGLSHNFVEDLYQDSDGFIWVATYGSLARYDGYEFVNFSINSSSADRQLKSNFVRKVTEDNFGRIWAASDGGIDVIKLSDLTIVEPEDLTGVFKEIKNNPIGYIAADKEGNLWLHNGDNITCLQFDNNGAIKSYAKIAHHANPTLKSLPIESLDCSGNGVVSEIDGKIGILKLKGTEIAYAPLVPSISLPDNVSVHDYLQNRDMLWIATDHGLYRCNLGDNTSEIYRSVENGGSLSQNFITSLALLPNNVLVAGTLNGLNILDPHINKFHSVKTADLNSNLRTFNHDFINCFLVEEDNLWIGTEGCGINLLTPRSLFATLYQHRPSVPHSISPHPVNAIYEDSDGYLWVGTVEGGLNRHAPEDEGFVHYTKENGALTHNSVSSITADRKGYLWVGTWGGGINVLNRNNPKQRLMVITRSTDGQNNMDFIGALSYDPYNDYIWIATNLGLLIYDFKTGEVRLPFPDADKITGTAGAAISPDGVLWLGGDAGLFAINLRKQPGSDDFKARHLQYKFDDPSSGRREKVTCLTFSHDGTLWIGTNGNGIYKRVVEGPKEEFINYNTTHGLPNDIAHGIAEGPQGNIWIATYHGLSCMTPDERFINFGKYNGLGTEQFYWNAAYRLANGNLLFGSIDGLLHLKGFVEEKHHAFHPVKFTSFKTEDETTYGNLHSSFIPQEEKNFEIGFSGLDYSDSPGGRFYYRMLGFDDEWKELPSGRHSLSYTNLSHGKYTLEVKYLDSGQSFADAPVSEFKLEIQPRFYKQTWFILLIILILICLVTAVIAWRILDLRKQRNKLQEAVDEGVKEIFYQKQFEEEQAQELRKQNEALRERNEQISQQRAQLAEMTQTLQKMAMDRVTFFTNITHEFRTPITLIIGPIERALKLSKNPKVIEQLNFVERNSKYLLSLVNQLMDYRKLESGKIDIVTTFDNFINVMEEVILPFRAFADERGIKIETYYHVPNPDFRFDHDALRKVVTNLVGNAVKFTPDNGKISIYSALMNAGECAENAMLYISVRDNGCGIPEGEIDKVFDRYYQGKGQLQYPLIGAASGGIGMYFCKEIVELHGGKISVKNNRGFGCTFRVLVPLPRSRFVSEATNDTPAQLPSGIFEEEGNIPAQINVLVVEDNADMRAYMKTILSEQYNVLEAADGREAMSVILSHPVDFIISDLMMPVMDGMELARQVKENFTVSHIPFVLLTAKADIEAIKEGYRCGVDDYISKPFDEEVLKTRIKNILENKHRYQRHFLNDMEVESLNIHAESKDKKFIDKVMDVVKKNYTNSYFDVSDFAEELGVSKSLLNKKLQSLVGQSANQLIRTYRLKIARELLEQNKVTKDLNVSEIAFKVGFNDAKYFTRCFTKAYGVSPSSLQRKKDDEG